MKTNAAAAYALRADPKKSLRVSDSYGGRTSSTRLSDFVCKICGKGFSKSRQLCGHLRHHTIGERREGPVCKECGKRFKSVRALCGHMKSHSSDDGIGAIRADAVTDCSLFLIRNVGVRKRARTPRFEVSKRTCFEFDSYNLNHEEGGEKVESGLEEVAASLIMLSQGLEFSSNVSVNAAVNGDGCRKVELVDQGLKSDGFEVRKSEGVEIVIGGCEKLSAEMELDVCKSLDESKNVGFGSSVKDETTVGQRELGGELVKSEDGVCSVARSMLKYKCISCDKDFSSHQALGGHRSSRHRWRCSSALKTETFQSSNPVAEGASKKPECAVVDVQKDEIRAVGVPHFELLKSCKHKRRRCLKIEICQSTNPVAEGTSKKPECAVADLHTDIIRSVGVAHSELLKTKQKCPLRFKVFHSVKALASHTGSHVAENSAIDQVQLPGGSMLGTCCS